MGLRRRSPRSIGKLDRGPTGSLRGSGVDTIYRKRHIGICTAEGETVSLNQLLVRKGYALSSESRKRAIQRGRSSSKGRSTRTLERLLRGSAGIPPWAKGRRFVGRIVQNRQRSRNTRGAVPRSSRDAVRVQHQREVCHARARNRQCRHLSDAGVPQLSCFDQTGSLVLFRGRCSSRRVSKGI